MDLFGAAGTLTPVKLISWNVNGLRAVLRTTFLDYLTTEDPEILCLQETRALPEEVEQLWPNGYVTHWNPGLRKGYSGTAIFTKTKPLKVTLGIDLPGQEDEGRVITAEFPDFHLVNVYTPNSQRTLARLPFRMEWDKAFLRHLGKLQKKKPVIFCGDLNVAHTEIDLANPKSNRGEHGFTDEERAGFDAILAAGFLDTFREFEKGGGHYSWWSQFRGARARNVGWRLDYFLISKSLRPRLQSAFIRPAILGSDHCPVGIELS